MSVNFNTQNLQQNNNFSANINLQEHQPVGIDVTKEMDLPTTPDEFRRFVPYSAVAIGFSAFVSRLATIITRLNPLKNPKITLEDSFNQSIIAKASAKIDGKLLPIAEKLSPVTNFVKSAGSKLTPNFIKNMWEKIKIGVEPKSSIALYPYNGPTKESARYFFKDCLGSVDKGILKQLGVEDLVAKGVKKPTQALQELVKRLGKLPAKNLTKLKLENPSIFGKNINLVDELNKSRAFLSVNAKTPVAKGFQKFVMSCSEAAGGGVIGGRFGLLMNAIFIASGIKRTWNAPKGEKFKTAMDALFVDFCGLYLTNLLGVGLAYRLLGLKNLDKSAKEIKNIARLTKSINSSKQNLVLAESLKNSIIANGLTAENVKKLSAFKINAAKFTSIDEILKTLASRVPSAAKINLKIDKLAAMKKYKPQGFFKDLLYKPLVAISNFLSVGLETLPSKLADSKTGVSTTKAIFGALKNKLKNLSGYPVRLILVAAIITPPLTKLLARATYSIFGKPSKPSVDIDGNKKNGNEQAQVQNGTPLININDFASYSKNHNQTASGFYSPLIEQAIIAQKQKQANNVSAKPLRVNESVNSSLAASSPIASSSMAATSFKDNYRYVPSTKPTVFKPKFSPEVARALKESEGIETAYNRAIRDIRKGNY